MDKTGNWICFIIKHFFNLIKNYSIIFKNFLVPTVFASDAIRQALSKILNQQNLQETSVDSQKKTEDILINRQSNIKPNSNDPGYNLGRSNVENTFHENSGKIFKKIYKKKYLIGLLRVTDSALINKSPPSEFTSFGSSSGFGGGRRPSMTFDEIVKSER